MNQYSHHMVINDKPLHSNAPEKVWLCNVKFRARVSFGQIDDCRANVHTILIVLVSQSGAQILLEMGLKWMTAQEHKVC